LSRHPYREIDRSLNDLNGKLDRLGLWPEESGNGHDHDHYKDYDKLARELYEDHRQYWYWHKSSWYWREVNGYDGQGCNGFTGCIPECPYADGRIDLVELERIKNEIKQRDANKNKNRNGTETEEDYYRNKDKTKLE
jgi:hypothetical protein